MYSVDQKINSHENKLLLADFGFRDAYIKIFIFTFNHNRSQEMSILTIEKGDA